MPNGCAPSEYRSGDEGHKAVARPSCLINRNLEVLYTARSAFARRWQPQESNGAPDGEGVNKGANVVSE